MMKDLYSFSRDAKEHEAFYEKAKGAYIRIYDRLGIGNETYVTFASGGSFAKYSHEFQTICEAGEDIIYVDEKKHIAVNKEVLNDEVLGNLGLKKGDLIEKKSVEVGNIFSLGIKYSEPLGLSYNDAEGKSKPVIMGSYGIGPGRAMGTIVETHADEKGLVWPEAVSPFAIHLVAIFEKKMANKSDDVSAKAGGASSAGGVVKKAADELYKKLTDKGIEVLYDDRECSAGEKFGDADLIGIPKRYVISEKTLKVDSIEAKDRATGKVEMVLLKSL
jgi:prolyl-tRNA synthetase